MSKATSQFAVGDRWQHPHNQMIIVITAVTKRMVNYSWVRMADGEVRTKPPGGRCTPSDLPHFFASLGCTKSV